ncbi:MAG: hypothetical protein HKO57_14400 [Akkermansiaceae bacterium]|nr:hypothetical protein [Akkermansiaceae bacterium]
MKETEGDSQDGGARREAARWQRGVERMTLVVAGACSGVVLYLALFPGFYYMAWIFLGMMLWAVVTVAFLLQILAVQAIAKWKRAPVAGTPVNGLGFIAGILVVVSLLIGFKVPLRASFLLARGGLEEALAEHRDDLEAVAHVPHNYGIYQIRKAERRCHRKDRVYFRFRDDGEAAIIYSESGIDDLCYNAGSKGHLLGNWYWMKED